MSIRRGENALSADIKLQPISCKVLRLVTIVLFIPVGAGSKFLEVDGKPYEKLDQGSLRTSLLLLRSVCWCSVSGGLQLANYPEQPPGRYIAVLATVAQVGDPGFGN